MGDTYEQLTAPDAAGCALFLRIRDGKVAMVKAAWFKQTSAGGEMMPRSRVKALRLGFRDWKTKEV